MKFKIGECVTITDDIESFNLPDGYNFIKDIKEGWKKDIYEVDIEGKSTRIFYASELKLDEGYYRNLKIDKILD